MAEPTQSENRHHFAGPSTTVAQTVEGGYASTHQWRGLHGVQFHGHHRHCLGTRDHVFGITAVAGDSGDVRHRLAREKISAAAVRAITAVPAMPADANSLPWLPIGDSRAHGVDHTDYFVPGH